MGVRWGSNGGPQEGPEGGPQGGFRVPGSGRGSEGMVERVFEGGVQVFDGGLRGVSESRATHM